MRRHEQKQVVIGAVLVATMLGTAAWVIGGVLDIDAGDSAGVTQVGTWIEPTLQMRGLIDDAYHYSQSSGAAITYTPGDVAGFAPGTYDIYTSWGISGNHTTNALITVNHTGGSTALPAINQALTAAQGEAGSMPFIAAELEGSGLYYLGQFTLDASSTIAVTRGIEDKALIADGVLLMSPDEGRLIDERTANVTVSNQDDWTKVGTVRNGGVYYEYSNSPLIPGLPYLSYHYSKIATAMLTFEPLSTGPHRYNPLQPGRYRIEVSWAAYYNHATNALFVVDINGDGDGADAGEGVFTIDQRKLADGTQLTTGAEGTVWSDYYDLGLFDLNASSRVILKRDNPQAGIAMSVDVLRLTYTPRRGTLFLMR